MVCGAFVGGHVAARQPDGVVEGRVTRPGSQDALVEVVAVHFGADDVPVDLVGNWPLVDLEGLEAHTQCLEGCAALREALGGVVRSAVFEWWCLEGSPVAKQGDQLVVCAREDR